MNVYIFQLRLNKLISLFKDYIILEELFYAAIDCKIYGLGTVKHIFLLIYNKFFEKS